MGVRTCGRCGIEKPVTDFRPCKSGRYLSRTCRSCETAVRREQYATLTEEQRRSKYDAKVDSTHRYRVRTKYGLGHVDHDAMLDAQGGLCAICRQPQTGRFKRLSVDHDHATGRVRGLLCLHCNVALGHLGDNVDRLWAAIEYLMADEQGIK